MFLGRIKNSFVFVRWFENKLPKWKTCVRTLWFGIKKYCDKELDKGVIENETTSMFDQKVCTFALCPHQWHAKKFPILNYGVCVCVRECFFFSVCSGLCLYCLYQEVNTVLLHAFKHHLRNMQFFQSILRITFETRVFCKHQFNKRHERQIWTTSSTTSAPISFSIHCNTLIL